MTNEHKYPYFVLQLLKIVLQKWGFCMTNEHKYPYFVLHLLRIIGGFYGKR